MDTVTGVTLGIALLGAVLGIINTAHALGRDRVRVRVRPTWVISTDRSRLGVEITNLGHVSVTIAEVGFSVRGRRKIPIVHMDPLLSSSLPFPLDPRSSVTIVSTRDMTELPEFGSVVSAYARTACGIVIRGTSGALRGAVKERRGAAPN